MEASYAAPAYKDRRTGLLIFGIALIAFGGFCLLLIPMAAVGQRMSARMTGDPANWRMLVPTVAFYGPLSLVFLSLGIGSIKGRRWARAVILVVSWAWLLVGVASLVASIWLGPKMLKAVAQVEGQALPPSAGAIIMAVMVGVIGLLFIIPPTALVLFYGSSHVKATVEALDPQPSWTDACPLPVLAVSLLAAWGAVTLLTMPIAYKGAIPIFGVILTGFVGSLAWLALAALLGYAAWSLYLLRPVGWWVMMAMLALGTVSNILTFSRLDLPTLYRHMGYPEKQIEQIEKLNIFPPTEIVIWSVVFIVPMIGYLVFIKKYFRRPTAVQPTPVTA